MVEGAPLAAEGDDAINSGVKIAQDQLGGNTQGGEAVPIEPLVAAVIPCRLIAAAVDLAVYLDRDAVAETAEIQLVAELRVLAAELQAIGSPAELLPEEHLRQAQLPAQRTSLAYVLEGRA